MPIQEKQSVSSGWQHIIMAGGLLATASTMPLLANPSILTGSPGDRNQLKPVYRSALPGTADFEAVKYYDKATSSSSSGNSTYETERSPIPLRKIEFIKELVEDLLSITRTPEGGTKYFVSDEELNEKSFFNALEFLIEIPNNSTMPTYDIHPDGEFSLVWRNNETGILSLAFADNGDINYASFFAKNNSRHKGKISLSGLNFNEVEEKSADDYKILFTLISKFS